MSNLTVITPPAEPPVSLADAKKYLRVGHAGEDQLIADLVEAASVRLEQLAGLALVKQTRQLTWLRWPATIAGRGLRLPISPIIELKSVSHRLRAHCSSAVEQAAGPVAKRPRRRPD